MDNIDESRDLKTILRLFPYIEDKSKASKLKIDKESYHYISIREIAKSITSIISYHLNNMDLNINNTIITDATAGVGGNTISFGMNFKYVNAIEIDPIRSTYLQNNINIYGLTNINVMNGNCINLLKNIKEQQVVYIDPPWGGKNYKNYNKLRLSLSNISLEQICNDLMSNKTKCQPELIILKLPINYDIEYLYKTVNSNAIYFHDIKKMIILSIINTN
jgi:16S rRNA G966 N2-methylase RsmD